MTHFWPKRANDLDIIKNPRQLTLEPAVSDLFTMGSGQRVQGLRKRGSCRPREAAAVLIRCIGAPVGIPGWVDSLFGMMPGLREPRMSFSSRRS
jgi:hypothetical protein